MGSYDIKHWQEIAWSLALAVLTALVASYQAQSAITDPRTLVLAVIVGAGRPLLALLYNLVLSTLAPPAGLPPKG